MNHHARRLRGRFDDERGAASTELVIATPLAMLLVLLVVQFAVWQHAVHVAHAVADQALAATRTQGGTAVAGRAEAADLLAQIGRPLHDPRVTVTRTRDGVRVVVTGHAQAVVPLLALPVRAVADGPVERLSPG